MQSSQQDKISCLKARVGVLEEVIEQMKARIVDLQKRGHNMSIVETSRHLEVSPRTSNNLLTRSLRQPFGFSRNGNLPSSSTGQQHNQSSDTVQGGMTSHDQSSYTVQDDSTSHDQSSDTVQGHCTLHDQSSDTTQGDSTLHERSLFVHTSLGPWLYARVVQSQHMLLADGRSSSPLREN